jgi:hypothetical protein
MRIFDSERQVKKYEFKITEVIIRNLGIFRENFIIFGQVELLK